MLSIDNVTVRIAGRAILEGASAVIPAGRRVGLVGRNGAGKTTLMNLILGHRHADDGEVEVTRSWRIGAVAQEAPSSDVSLIETVLSANRERLDLLASVESETDPLLLSEIHARLDAIDAYRAPSRAARILAGLGFSESDQQRPCREFSGGWRMRVALAGVLFSEPELLLLDEPTNYLDLEGTLWLEDYLRRYRGTVLLVSHDRDLLNRVVDSILHLERGKLTLYSGSYDIFARTRAERRSLDTARRAKQIAERERMQAFIDRFRAKASKAKQAQSRVKMLERMEPIADVVDEYSVPILLPKPQPAAPPLFSFENVSVGYVPGKPVLSRLYLRVDPDDRIALLGRNGNGKSTLAKLFAGRLRHEGGELIRARKLVTGYFAQHQLDELDGTKTAVETLSVHKPLFDDTTLRTQLGGFGFSGDKADTLVGQLSGGERARLMLAIATLEKPNLLVLDEPTNHLDMDAREHLLAALNDYEGAVILVSHDRRLIEACADRLLLVADGRAVPYEGDLDEYTRLVLTRASETGDTGRKGSETKSVSKADLRREAAQQREALKPLKRKVEAAEAEIAKLLKQIEEVDAALAAPGLFVKEVAKGEALSKQRAEFLRAMAAAEERWMHAAEAYEAASAEQAAGN
jgi:ATP-binding cassette subfamily F protein 3